MRGTQKDTKLVVHYNAPALYQHSDLIHSSGSQGECYGENLVLDSLNNLTKDTQRVGGGSRLMSQA